MALTPAQQQTLRTAIAADPVLAAKPANSDGAFDIAAALNLDASPAFYVWRSTLAVEEVMQNGFDWTRVDNATVGQARIWDWMMKTGTLRPSQANVRAGVLAAFPAAASLAMRLGIFSHFQRLASRAEKLFAVGTGTSSTDQGVGPNTLTWEGPLSYQDVMDARTS